MKRFLTYLIIVLIFFIIGLLMANFLLIPMVVRKGEEVSVPNVCNLPLDSATMVLRKKLGYNLLLRKEGMTR